MHVFSTSALLLLLGCGAPSVSLDSTGATVVCGADADGDGSWVTLRGNALIGTVVGALEDSSSFQMPGISLEPAELWGTTGGVDATDLPPERVHVVAHDELALRLDGLGLAAGRWTPVVHRSDGQTVTAPDAVVLLDAPVITDVAPEAVCYDAPASTLELRGAGFSFIDGVAPTVTVGDTLAAVASGEECAGVFDGVSVCDVVFVDLEPSQLALGTATVSLVNPEPAACAVASPARVDVRRAPEVLAVEPAHMCVSGGSFTVSGSGFQAGTWVEVSGATVSDVDVVDGNTLLVTLGSGAVEGVGEISVIDPGGCVVDAPIGLDLVGLPLAFAVDPAVVWSGADTPAVGLVAEVAGEIRDSWIEDTAGARVDVDWSWSADAPGSVDFVVPAGLSAGAWTLHVSQDDDCPGDSAAGFDVVDVLTVPVDAVSPAHAWMWTTTPIEIYGPEALSSDQAPFTDTPTVYVLGEGGDVVRLLGVRFRDGGLLSAVVPAELSAGAYDVLVVNPEGGAGVLLGGLSVTEDPPPTVTGVSPATLPNSGPQQVVVRGRDFRDPTVSLQCDDQGTFSTASATVDSADFSRLELTVSTTGLSQAVCVMEVRNSDDTSARWAALSVTNPAQNLFPWQVGAELNTGRRAAVAAAGRTTSVARYVYVIGGDDGDPASAMDSLEVAPVGLYGDLGAWTQVDGALPAGRTGAAAVTIGNFIYVVGGHDGVTPVSSTLRAMVLDPLSVPWFDALGLERGDAGPGPGT